MSKVNPMGSGLPEATANFYRDAMRRLDEAGLPFLMGGAYALRAYTGITRHTKDIDLFVREEDVGAMLEVLAQGGYDTEMVSPVWIAKAYHDDDSIDIIFKSGNGNSPVDDSWFEGNRREDVLGHSVRLCNPEDIIWSKSFVMARDRYDGADVNHLIRACHETLDWDRLLSVFDSDWRVLLSHLILFGYVYPCEVDYVPTPVMDELLSRVREASHATRIDPKVCRGTMLARLAYMVDVDDWGYTDGRVLPHGSLTAEEADSLSGRAAESNPGQRTFDSASAGE